MMDNRQGLRDGAMLGLVTGTLGSVLVPPGTALLEAVGAGWIDPLFVYTAGMTFGLGLGLYLWRFHSARIWHIILLVLLTPAIYYGAVQCAVIAHGKLDLGHEMIVPGLVGGAVGASLVALLVSLVLRPAGWVKLVLLVTLAGSVTGAVGLLFIDVGSDLVGMLALHVPWHAVVLAMLLHRLSTRG